MAADLDLPVDVVGCPLVREADGLAMSSRNAYLDADDRRARDRAVAARSTRRRSGRARASATPAPCVDLVVDTSRTEPPVALEYVEVVDAADARTGRASSTATSLRRAGRAASARPA